jgi:hypothetical protein
MDSAHRTARMVRKKSSGKLGDGEGEKPLVGATCIQGSHYATCDVTYAAPLEIKTTGALSKIQVGCKPWNGMQ